ncbi:uncharacterized protein LOC111083832 [Limulus polyphemus]|uniref:Uncharacterized protein LOC111083832 n=1 Tax=Limulus polyphemus TaxID=6850 RepID=A0ABM1RXY1_LIMPO|nr:uncharacterized protein LOC111083832 [Limulus polyphemus]
MSVETNMADVDNQRICEDLRTDKEQNYRSRKSKKLLFLNLTQKETSCYESSISATVPDMLRGSNIIKRNHNLQSLETERGSCVYSLETPLMDSIENDQKWEKLERKSPSLSTAV